MNSLLDRMDDILHDSEFDLCHDFQTSGPWTLESPEQQEVIPKQRIAMLSNSKTLFNESKDIITDPLSSLDKDFDMDYKISRHIPIPAAAPTLKNKKGTTTLGFRYQGGVILAVDSRASTGQYIASQTVQKVLEINPYLLGTMAGGAADCQYWERVLGMQCRLWQLRNDKCITVAAASKILANITYSYRHKGLSMGTMVAGWDITGPCLYYVDDQGQRIKHDVFSVGSGSIYAYGVLDAGYSWNLTDKEACELGRRSIYHATYRDGGSGGRVTVYHIHDSPTEQKWTRISRNDQTDLYEYYNAA